MSKYTDAVEAGLEGFEFVSTGICPGCPECMADYGYTDAAEFEAAWQTQIVYDEGHFSWSGCEICGSRLGGTFESWHAIRSGDKTLFHGSRACTDCVMYLANGDDPENWEG